MEWIRPITCKLDNGQHSGATQNIVMLRERHGESMKLEGSNIVAIDSVRKQRKPKLQSRYERFLELEKDVTEMEPQANAREKEALASAIIDLQAAILDEIATEKASNISDVVYKLAMWKIWSGAENGISGESNSLSDSLVLSALKDLEALNPERPFKAPFGSKSS